MKYYLTKFELCIRSLYLTLKQFILATCSRLCPRSNARNNQTYKLRFVFKADHQTVIYENENSRGNKIANNIEFKKHSYNI